MRSYRKRNIEREDKFGTQLEVTLKFREWANKEFKIYLNSFKHINEYIEK